MNVTKCHGIYIRFEWCESVCILLLIISPVYEQPSITLLSINNHHNGVLLLVKKRARKSWGNGNKFCYCCCVMGGATSHEFSFGFLSLSLILLGAKDRIVYKTICWFHIAKSFSTWLMKPNNVISATFFCFFHLTLSFKPGFCWKFRWPLCYK